MANRRQRRIARWRIPSPLASDLSPILLPPNRISTRIAGATHLRRIQFGNEWLPITRYRGMKFGWRLRSFVMRPPTRLWIFTTGRRTEADAARASFFVARRFSAAEGRGGREAKKEKKKMTDAPRFNDLSAKKKKKKRERASKLPSMDCFWLPYFFFLLTRLLVIRNGFFFCFKQANGILLLIIFVKLSEILHLKINYIISKLKMIKYSRV